MLPFQDCLFTVLVQAFPVVSSMPFWLSAPAATMTMAYFKNTVFGHATMQRLAYSREEPIAQHVADFTGSVEDGTARLKRLADARLIRLWLNVTHGTWILGSFRQLSSSSSLPPACLWTISTQASLLSRPNLRVGSSHPQE